MKNFLKIISAAIFLLCAGYLLYNPGPLPNPPANSLVSTEPADTESIYRKSYFTTLSRAEIMNYYRQNFPQSLRINHPPEEAATFIRDLTPSSWLEELNRPLKETVYINGYYPQKATDQIYRNGNHYQAKITVRYVPSHPVTRITVLILTSLALYWLIREYAKK